MPGRLKVWTTGQCHQYGGRRYLLDQQVQEFESRGVRPVQVFEDKEHRLALSVFQEDRYKRLQCFLSLALWGEVERWIVILRHRHREQRRKQRYRFL